MSTLTKILASLGITIAAVSLIANAIELVIISFILVGITGLVWFVTSNDELPKENE